MIEVGRKLFFLAGLSLVFVAARAQQDPAFSQYMYNQIYLNPGYSGVDGYSNLAVLHRTQYAGYRSTNSLDETGNPVTQLISISTPIFRINSGAGLYIVNDKLGPQNNLQVQATFAYHLAVGESKLTFGLNGGVYSQSINFDKYRPIDKDDPFILGGRQSQFRPDMGAGIYYRAEKYWGGIAVKHIIKSEFNFRADQFRNALENTLYIDAGYKYEVNYDLVLRPTILVKTDFNSYAIDLSVVSTYKDKFLSGLSYRQQESVTAILGYAFLEDNSLRLSYAFDLVIQGTDAKTLTSHEIMLNYLLPVLSGGGKKVVRTPRFRH